MAKVLWADKTALVLDGCGNCYGEFRLASFRAKGGIPQTCYTGYLYQGSRRNGTYKCISKSKPSWSTAVPVYQWVQEQAEKLVGGEVVQVRLQEGLEIPLQITGERMVG